MEEEGNPINLLKLLQAISLLECTDVEANKVLKIIKKSQQFYAAHSERGSAFDLQEIANAKEKIGCSADQAAGVLLVFQKFPDYNTSISFSKIKNAMNEMGCSAMDATTILIDLNYCKMESLIPFSKIKKAMKEIDCGALEAQRALVLCQDLPYQYQTSINNHKIKEAKNKINCSAEEAVRVLNLFCSKSHDFQISYADIKETKSALGPDSSVDDALVVLNTLYAFKKKFDVEPYSFSMRDISQAMKEIDCNAEYAVKTLFCLQEVWPKDVAFPFSEIKTIKEMMGGDQAKLNEALKLIVEKQKWKEGKITKQDWQDYLISVYEKKILDTTWLNNSLQIHKDSTVSMPVNQEEKGLVSGLGKMKIAQRVKPSGSSSTTTASKKSKNTTSAKKGKLQFKRGFLNNSEEKGKKKTSKKMG